MGGCQTCSSKDIIMSEVRLTKDDTNNSRLNKGLNSKVKDSSQTKEIFGLLEPLTIRNQVSQNITDIRTPDINIVSESKNKCHFVGLSKPYHELIGNLNSKDENCLNSPTTVEFIYENKGILFKVPNLSHPEMSSILSRRSCSNEKFSLSSLSPLASSPVKKRKVAQTLCMQSGNRYAVIIGSSDQNGLIINP